MKRLISILAAAFTIAVGVLANSHPDFPNNGKDSPRFYASPHLHPDHP